MGKKYFEIVFEGKSDVIYGMLEGFLLGKNADWEWFTSRESGIETDTLTEIIKEWASLKSRLHHFILEENFYTDLLDALTKKGNLRYLDKKYIKSAKEIKSCSFKFNAVAFAQKYGDEIKAILSAPPAGVTIINYNPVEKIDSSAKSVELYSPVHEYTFKGEGTAEGDFKSIISFRKILDEHPLVEVGNIKLVF